MKQHKNCIIHGFVFGKNIFFKIDRRRKNKPVTIICAICHRERNKKYREKNKEKISIRRKERFILEKDKINFKRRENYKKNPEKYRMHFKNHYYSKKKNESIKDIHNE